MLWIFPLLQLYLTHCFTMFKKLVFPIGTGLYRCVYSEIWLQPQKFWTGGQLSVQNIPGALWAVSGASGAKTIADIVHEQQIGCLGLDFNPVVKYDSMC